MALTAQAQVLRAAKIASLLKDGTISRTEASYLLRATTVNVFDPSKVNAVKEKHRVTNPNSNPRFAQQDGRWAKLSRTNVDHPFMFIFSALSPYDEPVDFGKAAKRTVLPVAPPQFDYSLKNNAQTFSAMSGKTFSHAGSEDLLRISFETFLPAGLTEMDPSQFPTYVYRNAIPASNTPPFEPPEFVEKIQAAQAANQPFLFSIIQSESSPDGFEIISPTPMTVTDFTPSYSAGQGRDISFSISLQLWNPQVEAMTTGTRVYITKPGDRYACGNIALRELGAVARYKEIKKLNETILKADHAKRVKLNAVNKKVRTDLITPGLRLMIPANKTPAKKK